MFTLLLCLQKDPGESDKGGFEGDNSLAMSDNDLYSSWKTGKALSWQMVIDQCARALN